MELWVEMRGAEGAEARADALVLGAAQATKVANLGHKVWIAGFNGDVAALKALNEGVFPVTATQQTQGMGRLAVIAKWIARPPRVFILDEPTRGIEVGARAAIYDVIADLARSGLAVVVVSSDLEEVLSLTHRLMVLSRGPARHPRPRRANDVAVMELATS